MLVFTNTTCPLVQKYWPKLKRLEEEYRSQGVQFVAVNVGPDDEIQEIAQQAIDFGVEFPFVKDIERLLRQGARASQRTPEVVVLDASGKLRYRGRIDDQYRLGGARPDVTERRPEAGARRRARRPRDRRRRDARRWLPDHADANSRRPKSRSRSTSTSRRSCKSTARSAITPEASPRFRWSHSKKSPPRPR